MVFFAAFESADVPARRKESKRETENYQFDRFVGLEVCGFKKMRGYFEVCEEFNRGMEVALVKPRMT